MGLIIDDLKNFFYKDGTLKIVDILTFLLLFLLRMRRIPNNITRSD